MGSTQGSHTRGGQGRASIAFVVLVAALLLAVPATAGAGAFPGTYKGEKPRGKVKVEVKANLKAKMRYSMRTRCGRVNGKLKLGKLKRDRFKARDTSGGETTVVRGKVKDGGNLLKGKLSEITTGPSGCNTGKRRFKASLPDDGLNPATDAGHYAGTTSEGLPFSFDLAFPPPNHRGKVSNMQFDIRLICVNVLAPGQPSLRLDGRVTGLSGRVDSFNEFDIYVEDEGDPDDDLDDLDYNVFGRVRNGESNGELEVFDGLFNTAGLLDPQGTRHCTQANWDILTFEATHQR